MTSLSIVHCGLASIVRYPATNSSTLSSLNVTVFRTPFAMRLTCMCSQSMVFLTTSVGAIKEPDFLPCFLARVICTSSSSSWSSMPNWAIRFAACAINWMFWRKESGVADSPPLLTAGAQAPATGSSPATLISSGESSTTSADAPFAMSSRISVICLCKSANVLSICCCVLSPGTSISARPRLHCLPVGGSCTSLHCLHL